MKNVTISDFVNVLVNELNATAVDLHYYFSHSEEFINGSKSIFSALSPREYFWRHSDDYNSNDEKEESPIPKEVNQYWLFCLPVKNRIDTEIQVKKDNTYYHRKFLVYFGSADGKTIADWGTISPPHIDNAAYWKSVEAINSLFKNN